MTGLQNFARLNWGLMLVTLTLCFVGVLIMYSITQGVVAFWPLQHLIRIIVSGGLAIFVAYISIRFWHSLAYIIYAVLLILLVAVELFGQTYMGAQRWLHFGFMQVQPSEFMRIGVMLALARYYHALADDAVSDIRHIAIALAIIGAPACLIAIQPDLGTALLLVLIGGTIMFLAGVRLRYFIGGLILLGLLVPVAWPQLHEYQRQRVLTFLDPARDPLGGGYQIIQSKIGIGSGGFSGKGYMQSTQSRLQFLPEKHTDFIFTLWAEEMGFIGSTFLLVLYSLLFILIIRTALRVRSRFACLVVGGVCCSIFFYSFVNLAMVTGLAPIVGVPLPFISFGGTSLLTFMFSIGLILSADIYAQLDI